MSKSGQRQFNIPERPAHARVYPAEFRLAMPECEIILDAFMYLLLSFVIKMGSFPLIKDM